MGEYQSSARRLGLNRALHGRQTSPGVACALRQSMVHAPRRSLAGRFSRTATGSAGNVVREASGHWFSSGSGQVKVASHGQGPHLLLLKFASTPYGPRSAAARTFAAAVEQALDRWAKSARCPHMALFAREPVACTSKLCSSTGDQMQIATAQMSHETCVTAWVARLHRST